MRQDDDAVLVTVTFMAVPSSVMACARMVAGVRAPLRRPVNDNSPAPDCCPTDNGPPDGSWFGAVMMERLIDRLARF